MTLVWVTFLIGTGVMFGMASLVIDLGYGMLQVRAMQNGADAGAMAAAKLMAGSVAPGAGGSIVYLVSNSNVHTKARTFAFYNHPAGLESSDYEHIAVEFLPCSGTSPTPNWTAQSDPAIVAEVGGTRMSSAADFAPAWACKVRVFARVAYDSVFAGVIGQPVAAATGRATAGISGSPPPTTFANVWPITRWMCNGSNERVNSSDGCDDDPTTEETACYDRPITVANPTPCVFWDSNSDPQGSFKHYVDMSRYSGLAFNNYGVVGRWQHLGGWGTGNCCSGPPNPPGVRTPQRTPVDYDPDRPGTSDRLNDVPYWVEHGWKGKLEITRWDDSSAPNYANCNAPGVNTVVTPAYTAPSCPNSRLETFREVQGQGNLGNNIKAAARAYIDLHKIDNSAQLCRFAGANNPDNDYADVTVFMWRYGEQDLDSGVGYNNSLARYDESRLWGNFQDSIPDQEGALKRVMVQRAANFRFCRGLVGPQGNGSAILGFFVSWFDPTAPPTSNPPSPTANTISLVE